MTIKSLVRKTCTELAQATGTSVASWSRYENGMAISEPKLVMLGEKLNLPPWEVLRLIYLRRARKNAPPVRKCHPGRFRCKSLSDASTA